MAYIGTSGSADSIISDALSIASGGDNDIANVLNDIKDDSTLNKNAEDISGQQWYQVVNSVKTYYPITSIAEAQTYIIQNPLNYVCTSNTPPVQVVDGKYYAELKSASDSTPINYGVVLTNDLNISEASGAMVIDDLMQKISTKVQVAAQMLSTSNNIAKTASRILSQG